MRGLFHHYLVPMWEEDFLLQSSLMGVKFLLFWVRGICPDRGWGRFHTLRGVKDIPAGLSVGDRGAAGLLGWIRTAEQRCGSRLGGTGGRPGAHPASPLMVLCVSLPDLRTVPWGLRGDGDMGALLASRAARPRLSLCLHFLLPGPALPRARSLSLGLRLGTGLTEPAALRAAGAAGAAGDAGAAAAQRLPALPLAPPPPPGSVLPARRRRLGSSLSFLA